ncbi:MAG: YihY/virulence factor BrkB family protein [bacterium]
MALLTHFVKSFFKKRLLLKAAALSYTTVLTLLPLLAITLSLSNFALTQMEPNQTDRLLEGLLTRFIPQVEVLDQARESENGVKLLSKEDIKDRIRDFIEEMGSGQIGLLGASIFLFLAFSLLVTIEHSMNDVWNVPYGRPLLNRIALYWTILTLGSVLVITAFAFTTRWQSSMIGQTINELTVVSRIINILLPFCLLWIGLTCLYIVLPNLSVNTRAALLGGLLAGILVQLNNILSFLYLFNVATAARLYGKLGLLPIFLGGLYVTWLIVLAGAQITHSIETVILDKYPMNGSNINNNGGL